jgi:hypothetical protein
MEPTIPAVRPDVAAVESAPRPTPTPVRVQFSEVLTASATSLVRGAEAAVSRLPGSPVMAVALRGGPGLPGGTIQAHAAGLAVANGGGVSLAAEGPGAGGVGIGTGSVAPRIDGGFGGPTSGVDGSVESSLAQAQDMNLYYLQIQQAVDAQNRQFTMLSNVLKAEHDTAKSAIDNIHS